MAEASGEDRSSANADGAISIALLLKVLRRWWPIATPAGLLLAAASAGVVWLRFEPKYEAAAWFRIEEQTPFLAFESKSSEARPQAFFQTQIELVRSPLVLGSVVKRPEIARSPSIRRESDPIIWLAGQLKVAAVGQSELFRITYASTAPEDAAAVVNAVTESYFNLRQQSESERNQRIIDLLEEEKGNRLTEIRRLRQDLRELARQATAQDQISSKPEADLPSRSSLADLQSRLIAAQVERSVLDARIQASEEVFQAQRGDRSVKTGERDGRQDARRLPQHELTLGDAAVDRAISERPEVQTMAAAIAAKQAHLQGIEALLVKGKKDSHWTQLAAEISRDQQLLEQLKERLRPAMRKEIELSLLAKRTESERGVASKQWEEMSRMRAEGRAQQILEERLQAEYGAALKNVQQSSGDTLELEFKRDELQRAEKVFELIAARSLQLQTERGAPTRVSLLRLAEPPTRPIEWFPYRNMFLGALAGFGLPFLLAFAWERLIRRVGDLSELEGQSPLLVLGEIACLPKQTPETATQGFAQTSLELKLVEESIDSLRTNLTLSKELRDLHVIALASAMNDEGKTSVAAQLATSLARACREPILLIDGDMRSPDLHRVFGVPLEPGLTKVLTGECPLPAAIVTTWSEHIHLLPAGRLITSPHTLLGNGAWKALLAQLPTAYRYVIIDTPPVLAASEALVLAQAADAALVCAMRDVSRVDQVRMACDRLRRVGAHPVGVVLNGVPPKHYAQRYGNYGYHDGGSQTT